MFTNRITDEMTAVAERQAFQPQAFCLMSVAAAGVPQMSPLQALYQQMYEQAQQIHAKPTLRDLFAIMN